jgi:hypothetical protein
LLIGDHSRMQQAVNQRRILSIVDAPADVQQWVDSFIESARIGGGAAWPHPHPFMPTSTRTLGSLVASIEANFSRNGTAWSVVDNGFPPSTDLPVLAVAAQPSDEPAPNVGSAYHNLLHSLLGNFH